MTLGYMDSIETAALMPLDQPQFLWNLKDEKTKIHVFLAPSGCGKTKC